MVVPPEVLASLPVTLDDVMAAREVLRGITRVSPLEGSRPLSERVGGPVLLKCENLQRTGSCLLYTSPSPRDRQKSRMPSSA